MKQLLYRFIYHPPINHLLRKIIKLFGANESFPLPPSGQLKIQLQSGKPLRLATNQTSQLTRLLYWDGYQNFEYTPILEELNKNISQFYDIGANTDYSSLSGRIENKKTRA